MILGYIGQHFIFCTVDGFKSLNKHLEAIEIFDPVLVSSLLQLVNQSASPIYHHALDPSNSFQSMPPAPLSSPPLHVEPDQQESISSPPLCVYICKSEMVAQQDIDLSAPSNLTFFKPNIDPLLHYDNQLIFHVPY